MPSKERVNYKEKPYIERVVENTDAVSTKPRKPSSCSTSVWIGSTTVEQRGRARCCAPTSGGMQARWPGRV